MFYEFLFIIIVHFEALSIAIWSQYIQFNPIAIPISGILNLLEKHEFPKVGGFFLVGNFLNSEVNLNLPVSFLFWGDNKNGKFKYSPKPAQSITGTN